MRGYAAIIDYDAIGLPLTAFVSIKPIDPAAPDDAPERLAHLGAIEACHSVAGDESYILKVRVASPLGLEELLQQIRASANVSTRTTVVLSTPYEHRAPDVKGTAGPPDAERGLSRRPGPRRAAGLSRRVSRRSMMGVALIPCSTTEATTVKATTAHSSSAGTPKSAWPSA